MAVPEQPRRNAFEQIIGELGITNDNDFMQLNESLNGPRLRVEEDPKVKALYEAGLGKIFKISPSAGNLYERIADQSPDQAVMFGLAKEVDRATGRVVRALLIFPNETTTEYCIVRPTKSRAMEAVKRQEEDKAHLENFNTLFSPSRTPFVHSTWHPRLDRTYYQSFITRPDLFASCIEIESENVTEQDKKAAIATERAMKRESLKKAPEEEIMNEFGTLAEGLSNVISQEQAEFDTKFASLVELFDWDDQSKGE